MASFQKLPIRQADVTPIKGGWHVNYVKDGVHLSIGGLKAGDVIAQIVAHRQAQGLPPELDAVTYECLSQWYARDPARFTSKPQPPTKKDGETAAAPESRPVDQNRWRRAVLDTLLLLATDSNKKAVAAYMPVILDAFACSSVGCDPCAEAARDFLKRQPISRQKATNIQEWVWELYASITRSSGGTPKPIGLVRKEWDWK